MQINIKNNFFSNKYKNICLMLIAICFLLLNHKLFADSKANSLGYFYLRKLLEKNALEHVNELLQDEKLISKFYKNYKSKENDTTTGILSDDFKWVFDANGFSFTTPVVDPNNTIYTLSTDFSFNKMPYGFKTSLYALQSESIEQSGKENWVFNNVDGIATFPPAILFDGTIIVESIEAINGATEDLHGKLYAIDQNGKNKWGSFINFDNEIFLTAPVTDQEGSLLITTVNTIDFENINNSMDVATHVSSINMEDGGINWSFKTELFNNEDTLIMLTQPVINRLNNTVLINTINAKAFTMQDEIDLFLNEFESSVKIDELKKDELREVVRNGEDFTSIINDIENDVKLQLDNDLDKFVGNILNHLCTLIALDKDDGTLKWQSAIPGICFTSSVLDTKDDKLTFIGQTNFSLQTNLDINVDITVVDPKDPEGDIDINIQIIKPDQDGVVLTPFGVLSAVEISTGNIVWTSDINDAIFLSPVFDDVNNRVIVSGNSDVNINFGLGEFSTNNPKSRIYAINVSDGSMDWVSESFDGIIGFSSIDSNPTFPLLLGADGSIIFVKFNIKNSDNINGSYMIHAINSDGTTKWLEPFIPDGFLTSAPVLDIVNSSIIFNMFDLPSSIKDFVSLDKVKKFDGLTIPFSGKLVTINNNDGTIRRLTDLNGLPLSSPTIDSMLGTVYSIANDFELSLKPFELNLSTSVHAIELF